MWGRFLSFHKYRLLKPLTRKHYRTITIVFHRRKLAFAPQRLSQTLKSLLQYPLVTSQVHWYRTQKKESALVPESLHSRLEVLRNIFLGAEAHEAQLKLALEQLNDLTETYSNEKDLWVFKKEMFTNLVIQPHNVPIIIATIEEDIKNYPKLFWPLWVKACVLLAKALCNERPNPSITAVEIEKAVVIVNDLLTRPDVLNNPFQNDLLILKAFILNHLKKYEEVLKICEDLLRRSNLASSSKVDVLILKSYALSYTNIPKAALQTIDEALQIDPSHYLCWNIKAELLYKNKQYSEAAIANEKAMQLLTTPASDSLALGIHRLRVLLSQQIPISEDKLLESCNFLLYNCPSSLILWMTKGRVLYRMEQYQDALDSFNRALKLAVDNVEEHEFFAEFSLERKAVMNELFDIIPKIEQKIKHGSIKQ